MANLSQAQAQALFEQQLSTLGTSPDSLVFETNELSAVEKAVGSFIDKIHQSIESEKLNLSGSISDIQMQSTGNEVIVTAPKHLLFQNYGVQGAIIKKYPESPFTYVDKMPPVDVFKNMIKSRNIQLRVNEQYDINGMSPYEDLTEDELINKAAWGMAKKVYKEGFKPRHIYSKHVDSLMTDLENEITGFAIQQLIQNIDIKPQANQVKR